MSSELVVDVQPKEISIALLENNRLVELQKEARNISFSVGDIYLGCTSTTSSLDINCYLDY